MLGADGYRVLKKAVASRTIAVDKARQAKIVLLSDRGYIARETAGGPDHDEGTALKWIGRFDCHGVAGFDGRHRSRCRSRRDGRRAPAVGPRA